MSLDVRSVRTETDGDVSVQLYDADTATSANVNASGQVEVSVESTLSNANDDVLVYGFDGTNNQAIATDANGELQVDVLSQPARSESTDSIQIYGYDGTANQAVATNTSGEVETVIKDVVTGTQTDDLQVDINAQTGPALDVSAATVTVTDDGAFDATVTQSTHTALKAAVDLYVGESQVTNDNPVPVADVGSAGTPQADYLTSAALAGQSSETLTGTAITSGTTGTLEEVVVSSEVPFKAEIQKFDGTTATTIGMLQGEPGDTIIWQVEATGAALFDQAGTGTELFQVVVTNNNDSGIGDSGDVHVTLSWTE